MLGYWLLFGGWRWNFGLMSILAAINFVAMVFLMEETYAPCVAYNGMANDGSVIQRKMLYEAVHPLPPATQNIGKVFANLKWMRAMVSRDEAKDAFVKAFSRPPRLLLGNPVALIFSLYYSYIYGACRAVVCADTLALIYLFLVSIPLLFGSPPYSRPTLFTYGWPQATLPLGYLSLGMHCARRH